MFPDLLDAMRKEHPITAPGERPADSNLAYNLFELALEEYTGKNYGQLVQEIISTGNHFRAIRSDQYGCLSWR